MPSLIPFNLRFPSSNLLETVSTVSVWNGEVLLTLSHAPGVKNILSDAASSVISVREFHSSSLVFILNHLKYNLKHLSSHCTGKINYQIQYMP